MLSDSYVSIQGAFTWVSYQTASSISSVSQTVQKLFPYPWEQKRKIYARVLWPTRYLKRYRVDKCSESHLLGKCPAFSLHPPVGSVFHKVLGVVPGCLLYSQT